MLCTEFHKIYMYVRDEKCVAIETHNKITLSRKSLRSLSIKLSINWQGSEQARHT